MNKNYIQTHVKAVREYITYLLTYFKKFTAPGCKPDAVGRGMAKRVGSARWEITQNHA